MNDHQPSPDEAAKQLSNPANAVIERKRPPRRPLSTPHQRLQTPDIPGWHLHWFKEDNVPLALDAYYEFVDRDEVRMNQLNVAIGTESSGTDMGSRVSMIADKTESGHPVRAYLMKIREEYFIEDQKALERMNLGIMEAIFGDEAKLVGEGGKQSQMDPTTYIDRDRTAIYNRKTRKAVIRKRR